MIRQLVVFGAVGLAATGAHVGVSLAANHWLMVPTLIASIFGYLSAVLISYFGNAVLTFNRPVKDGFQILRFAATSVALLLLNLVIVWFGVNVGGAPFWAVLCVVAVIIPASSFGLSKLWVFAASRREI